SDVWVRPDLLQAVYALARELESRGALVSVLKLPAGPEGLKVGLDDFLLTHALADLDGLPRFTLKSPALARFCGWWKGWYQRKASESNEHSDAITLLERGETVRFMHPAQDVIEGVLWYGVPTGGTVVLINSQREVFQATELPAGLVVRHA